MEMCTTAPAKTIPRNFKYFSLIWYHLWFLKILISQTRFLFPFEAQELGFYCSDTSLNTDTNLLLNKFDHGMDITFLQNRQLKHGHKKIIITNLLSKHIQSWIAPDVSVNEHSIPYSFVTVKIQSCPIISSWSTTKSTNFKRMQSYVNELSFLLVTTWTYVS